MNVFEGKSRFDFVGTAFLFSDNLKALLEYLKLYCFITKYRYIWIERVIFYLIISHFKYTLYDYV